MYKVLVFTLLVAAFIVAYPATAHPGNTAADGCHYCRTNCDKWGEVWNERHCHNAKSVPAPLLPVSTPKPVTTTPVVLPTKLPTPIPATPTSVPTSTSTIAPAITPESTLEPAVEGLVDVTEQEIKPSFTLEPTFEVVPTAEIRKPSAWTRFRAFLGRIFGRT